MRLGPATRILFLGLVAVLVGPVLPATLGAPAAAAAPASLILTAPAGYADRDVLVTATLSSGGAPVVDAAVALERFDPVSQAWSAVGTDQTDAAGRAEVAVTVSRTAARNRLRATFDGDASYSPASALHTIALRAHPTVTSIAGPRRVVDERSVHLRLGRHTTDGRPVAGAIALQRRGKGRWRTVGTYRANAEGYVRVRLRPRADRKWRAVGVGLPWAARSASPKHRINNLPPGAPVRLRAAPRPRVKLPAQQRARGAGANPAISRISDRVWRSMVGRSWHRGCPVGRSGLRILRINYWDFSGYRRRGEVVAAASVIRQMSGALRAMYRAKLPIRSMYRVDRFGWSRTLKGANDYRSMAADNTSAFNCRWVVGRPGVRSPHSYGRSLDINPWENPYRSRQGWVPNRWWPSRSHARVAWRSRAHRVVRIMARHGLRWTYGRSDLHHFDAVPRGGRLLVPPGCDEMVCH